jgi:hypothetical protein
MRGGFASSHLSVRVRNAGSLTSVRLLTSVVGEASHVRETAQFGIVT